MKEKVFEKDNQWVKKIALFITSQSISLFGSSLVQFAIMWYITLQTKSGAMMTISTLCGFLPQILISLFAGVWADRYDRKKLIVISDGLIAASTLVLAIFFLCGFKSIWLLFVVSAVRSLGSGVQTPATNAIIPQFVPEDKLMKVNGLNQTIHSLMFLISPAVSGAVLGMIGIEMVFFIDVFTAIIGISVMLCIKIDACQQVDSKSNRSYFGDMISGFRYIKKSNFLVTIVIFSGVFNILVAPAAILTPLLIARNYGTEIWRLTANEVAFSIGTLLGGIIITLWGGFKNKTHTIGIAAIAFGILTAVIGFVNTFVLYLIVIVVTGFVVPFFSSPSIVLLQETVENEMRGRIFSIVQIISTSALPIGMMIFGPLSDSISLKYIFIATGVLMGLMGIIMFFTKAMRQYAYTIKYSTNVTTNCGNTEDQSE
ncbi:MFS transporter [Paludicola sp. MB14-C6]|uniref:MFS transporter n=1 Tax=Paludihabitans sp. MB14-C6 TaxID=3070656 RepID=UPI0027DAC2EB|nr:MFS transporter [Paludicola sp. MB14-C6]WMJ21818.1 MFS transporter [Paludicola sp. MB14-C6]